VDAARNDNLTVWYSLFHFSRRCLYFFEAKDKSVNNHPYKADTIQKGKRKLEMLQSQLTSWWWHRVHVSVEFYEFWAICS